MGGEHQHSEGGSTATGLVLLPAHGAYLNDEDDDCCVLYGIVHEILILLTRPHHTGRLWISVN